MSITASRRPPVVPLAAKTIGLIVYAMLIAEVFIRLVHPQPRMPRYVTGTAWGVRGNIPNAVYRHSTAEVDVGFAINGQGMRADRDFPEAKPAGTCRIALLGDSFMMGYELNLPDTFAARLEKGLNEAGRHVEVLNFAVSGFGTAESLRTYEAYAQRFDPDIVIMEWDRSDYDDNVRSDLYRLNGGVLVATGNSFLPSVGLQEALMRNPLYGWLVEHSDLFSFARETLGLQVRDLTSQLSSVLIKMRGWRQGAAAGDAEVKAAYPQPWAGSIAPEAVTLSAALLEAADRTVESQHRGFLVLEIPYQYPHNRSVSSLALIGQDRLRRLPVASSVAAFNAAAAGPDRIFYQYGDGHITPFAVGLLLEPVLARLKGDPHLAGCPAS